MFTVLIAEKEHIDAIRCENKLFFEPFLESKELELCYWNPLGQTLQDSVPGLIDVVGRRKDWRAVIINDGKASSLKQRNPFDTVDFNICDEPLTVPNRQLESDKTLEEWEASWTEYYDALLEKKKTVYNKALELPLQKLATWLCFKPEEYILNDVKEKQDVYDWALERLGSNEINPSVKLELIERNQYKKELRLKETIRRTFVDKDTLNVSYPSEVYCISTREGCKNYFDPDIFWSNHKDEEYSTFADRNMYFDTMRFLVFDVLSSTHCSFRSDYIRFLTSVLIFSLNQIPSSAMQARRLYKLEVDSDDSPLCTIITSYDKKLAATYDVIENEMEQIRSEIPSELTDKVAEQLFCTPKDIIVSLDDSCDVESLYAEKNYGLFLDSIENEHHKWHQSYNESKKALAYIIKQHSRSVRRSIQQMHISSEVSDANISRLTSYQVDDVSEYTDSMDDAMVLSIPPNFNDDELYQKRLDMASDKVQRLINRRMTRKTGLILSIIFLLLYCGCFLPFIISNYDDEESFMIAISLCGGALGTLAIMLFISLLKMRSSVINAVMTFNDSMREIIKDINISMKQYGKYLSALCNVRRGNSVQNYVKKNLDEYTKSLRIRRKHQEEIRKKRAYISEYYGDYLCGSSYCDETMSYPYDYDFDQTIEYAYPAPFLADDYRQIEFISNGNLVNVPSSYITRILVRLEGIYEK